MNTGLLPILQLNVMKTRAAVEALINDLSTQGLDILLIQEPLEAAHRTFVTTSCGKSTSQYTRTKSENAVYYK